MITPRGTPYRVLRALALEGRPPSRQDCETCERHARLHHSLAHREFARLELLIARALWSAWRARFTQPER